MSSSTGICVGETATLSATGATTYTWNTGVNAASITISPTATTIFTLAGTDGNGCSSEIQITQEVLDCTGFGDVLTLENQITIYPNPSSGLFKVTSNLPVENTTIEVYDLLGQKIINLPFKESITIDLTVYPAGVYTAVITSNDNLKAMIKIIRQ